MQYTDKNLVNDTDFPWLYDEIVQVQTGTSVLSSFGVGLPVVTLSPGYEGVNFSPLPMDSPFFIMEG